MDKNIQEIFFSKDNISNLNNKKSDEDLLDDTKNPN